MRTQSCVHDDARQESGVFFYFFALCLGVFLVWVPASASAQWDVRNFESGPVRPIAANADGSLIAVTNIPDQRVELFTVSDAGLAHFTSVRVGMEPVALAFRGESELWVVNHLSDSVSVVEIGETSAEVRDTLLVGDEPRDIVFAGPSRDLAFVTTAHRGQNSPYPRGEYETPGIGRADVWVFDATGVASGEDEPEKIVTLFGDKPRPLAVSPDGLTVYAGIFHSGNRTTAIPESTVCNGGEDASSCVRGGTTVPGGVPGPNQNHEGIPAPETGLIIRWSPVEEKWLDELDRDWSEVVPFELPDYDVFAIDASSEEFDVTEQVSTVGTILFNMTVDPISGDLLVTNTEARNEVRFEGPGDYVEETDAKPEGEPASVIGHQHEARISFVENGEVFARHLNPHLDYEAEAVSESDKARSIATPLQVEVSSDGSTIYVAAFGSNRIATIPYQALRDGSYEPDASDDIDLPGGPAGFVLNEEAEVLAAYTRYDNSVVLMDLAGGSQLQRIPLHSPEPDFVTEGRRFLYDAQLSSSNGEASCASCHVFGDTDGLAWDLGDPDGDVASNPNPEGPIGNRQDFHPMKGPMLTQTLRGLANHGPLHWRGDRTGFNTEAGDAMNVVAGFTTFNVAFEGLLGRDGEIPSEDMLIFSEFGASIVHPPNPIRKLDRSLREDEQAGRDLFFDGPRFDQVATCEGCHRTDGAQGFYGTDGKFTFEGEPQEFKVAQLRDLYQRVGMFGMANAEFFRGLEGVAESTGPQVRGYGFLHDGSVDSVEHFLHADVFNQFSSNEQRDQLEAFMMAFNGEMAPVVGQQVTLGANASPSQLDRAQLLMTRSGTEFAHPFDADQRECDVVAHLTVEDVERGFIYRPEFDEFQSDKAAENRMSWEQLQQLASDAESSITLTAVPPGAGWRMAVDRDADRAFDADERTAGTDPTDPDSVPEEIIAPADPPWEDINCEETPQAEECQPPTCEEDPSQERCEPPTCEEDPSQERCQEPSCEEAPSQERCEEVECDDGSAPPCEINSNDGEGGSCSTVSGNPLGAALMLLVAFGLCGRRRG
jgi:DNA-binding beta-propeller fold protein YncE